MITGIYKITNKLNGKCYIGRAKNINRRWTCHKNRAFVPNKEYNKYLYRAFRKYGLDNFKFEILEECAEDELDDKEHYYITLYNSNNEKFGYNETTGYDHSSYGVTGENHPKHILTEEDVYYIRECYNNHYKQEDVFEEFSDIISFSGFHKVWGGTNWKNIHMDVYTQENKDYYNFQRNSHPGSMNGRAKVNEDDVYQIRLRKAHGESSKIVYEDYKEKLTWGSFRNIWSYQNWKNININN